MESLLGAQRDAFGLHLDRAAAAAAATGAVTDGGGGGGGWAGLMESVTGAARDSDGREDESLVTAVHSLPPGGVVVWLLVLVDNFCGLGHFCCCW